MDSDKQKQLVDLMVAAIEKPKLSCPGCGAGIAVEIASAWEEHTMTVKYCLAAGHKMGVEEFAESIKALAKCLKVMAREMGARVQVLLQNLAVDDEGVSATVVVARVVKQ